MFSITLSPMVLGACGESNKIYRILGFHSGGCEEYHLISQKMVLFK
jgi:hypothetical protein